MNKSKIQFLVIFSLIIFSLNSCNNTNTEVQKNNKNNIKIEKKSEKIKTAKEKNISLAMKNKKEIIKLEKEIKAEDVIFRKNPENNELLDKGFIFLKNLEKTKDIKGEIKKLPKNIVKDFSIKLNIYESKTAFDDKKTKVDSAEIFINGIKIGETKNGIFIGEFSWPKGIEIFTLKVKSEGYGDSISFLNYKNLEYKLINREIFLKKSFNKEVIIKEGESFSVKGPKEKYIFSKCSFLDKNGKCYSGKANVSITNYDELQMNNSSSSVTRRGINKDGKIEHIYLFGASFFEINDKDGNKLELKKDKNFIIEYKLTEKELKKYLDKGYINSKEDDYNYFDKKYGLWKITKAKYSLDKENKILKIETSKIY